VGPAELHRQGLLPRGEAADARRPARLRRRYGRPPAPDRHPDPARHHADTDADSFSVGLAQRGAVAQPEPVEPQLHAAADYDDDRPAATPTTTTEPPPPPPVDNPPTINFVRANDGTISAPGCGRITSTTITVSASDDHGVTSVTVTYTFEDKSRPPGTIGLQNVAGNWQGTLGAFSRIQRDAKTTIFLTASATDAAGNVSKPFPATSVAFVDCIICRRSTLGPAVLT
jgi:hypothetical protein